MTATLSAGTIIGLYFMQKYRFLTISQIAKITGFSQYHSGEVLRGLERWGYIGYFGNTHIPGQGKTPKVYFLKRKGWETVCLESNEDITPFSEVQKETTWTPKMYHRIKTIDLLLSLEIAINNRPHLRMIKVFLEYRMIKKGSSVARETTDFVALEETSDNKLVPDAAFIIENIVTKKRALFFVEMDMGTERIVSQNPRDIRQTLHYKVSQYDKYLKSSRYRQTLNHPLISYDRKSL